MPINLVTKKFSMLQRDYYEQIIYRSICSDQKNNYLRKRLFKTLNSKKTILCNFKKYWLCFNCLHIYSLKPLKRYKTLQQYPLQCPKCYSENVGHNSTLSKTIIDKKAINGISSLRDDNIIELACDIKNFNRYYIELDCYPKQKNIMQLEIILS